MTIKELSELKTELSKLAGVDFHSPKYRAVFKRLLAESEDKAEDEGASVSEDTAAEVAEAKQEDAVADAEVTEKAEEVVADIAADKEADAEGETPDYNETAQDEAELVESVEADQETDANVQEAEAADDTTEELTAEERRLAELVGEDTAEETTETETAESDTTETAAEVATEAESVPAIDLNGQLLETKLELELVRAGVREDRLEVAKRLFLPELQQGMSIEDLRIKIAAFPEWLAKAGGVQGFGMPLGDNTSALTNEEKRLKQLGVDPK